MVRLSPSPPIRTSQHMFYDAKALNGFIYLSSTSHQVAGYIDALSRKGSVDGIKPGLVFVTTTNTFIHPSVLATAKLRGVDIYQSFVLVNDGKLYLTPPVPLTTFDDAIIRIPSLKLIGGPVDLEYPTYSNLGPDFEEVK